MPVAPVHPREEKLLDPLPGLRPPTRVMVRGPHPHLLRNEPQQWLRQRTHPGQEPALIAPTRQVLRFTVPGLLGAHGMSEVHHKLTPLPDQCRGASSAAGQGPPAPR